MSTNNGKGAATAVVIDSHPLRQQLAETLLQRHAIAVVAVSTTIDRAAELTDVHGCDLLIVGLDEGMEAKAVYTALRKAHKRCPQLVTVALVENDHPAIVEAALSAGAFAAVGRSASMQEVARVALEALSDAPEGPAAGTGRAARARLTRREIEILRLVAEGRSNREVAKLLWVTDQTVKFHLANTYRKLGVRNRVEASHWAYARGLVRPEATPLLRERSTRPEYRVVPAMKVQGDAVAVTP
jgi:DNA-binding NarL/FixJ family response regulator